MRMWMVNPRIMCRQHLLGEHVEIHMFIGTLNRKKSVKGYLEKGLLEIHNLYARHEILVEEMKINKEKNVAELVNCCSNGKRRHSKFMEHQLVEINASD